MDVVIVEREQGTRPRTFPKMSLVAFRDAHGAEHWGYFTRMFTPARGAGKHYEIHVGGYRAVIFAQGPVGRTVTRQEVGK